MDIQCADEAGEYATESDAGVNCMDPCSTEAGDESLNVLTNCAVEGDPVTEQGGCRAWSASEPCGCG